jgi:hypothetical protein
MREPVHRARHIGPRLAEALSDSPVVLLHGPRQSGKTTLARRHGEGAGMGYVTLEDPSILKAAREDPSGFVADLPERVVIDEVQRAPDLLMVIKASVDRRRLPGRFLLTGSANVLLVPRLSDSLAGRTAIVRLHPLSQAELAGPRLPGFLPALFGGTLRAVSLPRLGPGLADRIGAGGYPAALARPRPGRRAAWHRDHVETILRKDVRDLARIRSLDVLSRLLTAVSGRTATLLNVAGLGAPFPLTRPTIAEYVSLLERLFLIDLLPPWHSNRLSRLIKTPKVHVGDTGLACALLGLSAEGLGKDRPLLGRLLESFVVQELRRQATALEDPIRFFHFRQKDGAEVDVVLEQAEGAIAGVEVKASATVTSGDFAGLRKLRDATGSRFAGGVVLYDGEAGISFGEQLRAVPMRELWEAR